MERIASNIAGNIARCGCPFTKQVFHDDVTYQLSLFVYNLNNIIILQITQQTIDLCPSVIH